MGVGLVEGTAQGISPGDTLAEEGQRRFKRNSTATT